MLTRRSFLASVAGAIASATLPLPAVATEPLIVGVDLAKGPDLMAFAIGTPGEFDWQSIWATSMEEAWREYLISYGLFEEDEPLPPVDGECVTRVPLWDHLAVNEVASPADWFAAGFGYICGRCGFECHPEDGALIVDSDAVCDECLTIGDRALVFRREDVIEELADGILDDGADDYRHHLEREGHWSAVEALWPEALSEAAKRGANYA